MFFGFAKQTEKQSKQIEFRFVSVRTEKKIDCFEDTLLMRPESCRQRRMNGGSKASVYWMHSFTHVQYIQLDMPQPAQISYLKVN
jgi:hypothetical protein